jgi:hypothetical protein
MKRILELLLLLACASPVWAQLDTYRFKRPLPGVDTAGWYEIPLSLEVQAHCGPGQADVRLFKIGKDTLEVPYLLRVARPSTEPVPVEFRIINKSVDKQTGLYELTLHLPKRETVSRIEFDFVEDNYDWNAVELEGGFDQREWRTLAENLRLMSIRNEEVEYRYNRLAFEPANYPYYRVRISTRGLRTSHSPLEIRRVYVTHVIDAAAAFDTVRAAVEVSEHTTDRTTDILLTLEQLVGVDELHLTVGSAKDYYRTVTVSYLADSVKSDGKMHEVWASLAGGVVSSLEPFALPMSGVRTPKLKLRIINRSDQPLPVDRALAMRYRRVLVAELEAGTAYALAYGKDDDARPVYDLQYFADKVPSRAESVVPGKEAVVREEAGRRPFFEQSLWIWGAMVVIMVLLAFFSIRMLKRAAPPT